ncbi:hypothetical protein WICPIJ_009362 [Wickerhamomyces pijperi]|uniref:Vacuolar import and degradation protein 27 n=1 Tax=Wickerhamomyces pijperi TaxID=599730 RepID=A0A9P8TDG8_WICPI|nr:hypothetical protein WICPIJ_009362 [Wickerhamomyces pijperi]
MNILKRFLGSTPKSQLSMIPSGQFYLKRSPGSPKSANECLFTDAVASIRETSTPYNYILVVQKAYEEGEEPSKEDDGDDDDSTYGLADERIFLIDSAINIHVYNKSSGTVVSWLNKEGDEGESFEFVVDESVKNADVEQFMRTIRSCCFERKYRRSSVGVTDNQLEEFIYDPDKQFSDVASTEADDDEFDEWAFQDAKESITTPTKSKTNANASKKPVPLEPALGTEIATASAELRLYDPVSETFKLVASDCKIKVIDLGSWNYWLSVVTTDISVQTSITPAVNPIFNYEQLSFIFNADNQGRLVSWLLRFESPRLLLLFQTAYMKASYEGLNQIRWEKAEDSERKYNLDAFKIEDDDSETEKYLAEDESDESEEEEEYVPKSKIKTAKKHDPESEDEETQQFYHQSKNKNLTISYTNDRTYVTNGNNIGVFKSTEDDDMKLTTAIKNLSLGSKEFVPDQMMLHEQDSSLIMKGGLQNDTLYRMDLTKGKVVDEWKVKEDVPVVAFGPSKKFNQLTLEKTFLGISEKGLFKIDPRLNGNKLVESESKTYATKNDFSSFGTTANGFIAVASNKGDIRLYDKLGIRAKSLIPAIGDAIKNLDVSADGKWLLATCATYLILIDLTLHKGTNAGSLAFNKSFGKDNIPKTKILRIRPEHVAHMKEITGESLNFTGAYFNTGTDAKEQTIVSSSGPYAITWSLKKVLRGEEGSYLIKRYGSNVVGDNFKFGTDKNVVVALEDDVGIAQKREFKKANKNSLSLFD